MGVLFDGAGLEEGLWCDGWAVDFDFLDLDRADFSSTDVIFDLHGHADLALVFG